MCLTIHNQLTLLHDLLDEQITYRNVSIEEYKQIKKLVQMMIVHHEVEKNLLTILPEIYYYGIKGEKAQSLFAHITENESKIKRWMKLINVCRLQLSS